MPLGVFEVGDLRMRGEYSLVPFSPAGLHCKINAKFANPRFAVDPVCITVDDCGRPIGFPCANNPKVDFLAYGFVDIRGYPTLTVEKASMKLHHIIVKSTVLLTYFRAR